MKAARSSLKGSYDTVPQPESGFIEPRIVNNIDTDSNMSLRIFVQALLVEKEAHTFTLIQDNPIRNAMVATPYKRAPMQTKERPSLAKSTDSIAPKLPLRQRSDEELGNLEPSTMLNGNMMGGSLYRNEIFATSKSTSSSSSDCCQATHAKHEDSVFSSFCDETKGILMQLPSSRYQ